MVNNRALNIIKIPSGWRELFIYEQESASYVHFF